MTQTLIKSYSIYFVYLKIEENGEIEKESKF